MIQHFLIMKRTGENIYQKSFGEIDVDETIMSGFFSAFFTFTQSLFKADVQDMDLGPYRILFEVVGEELILVIMFDRSDSILNVQQILIEIKNIIEIRYSDCIMKPFYRIEDFEGLPEIIENLVLNTQTIDIGQDLKHKYLKIMDKLSANNEILDCMLITIEGIPLIMKGRKDFLDLIINQMDAFWKFKGVALDQIILDYEKRYNIFHRVNDDLILGVFVRRDTPIGPAIALVKEVAAKIAKLYPK